MSELNMPRPLPLRQPLPPPLTPGAAGGQIWDALIIGAGVAGTLAAREAARCGLQTLIVERKQIPRDKVCGGCLNARAVAVLDALGLEHVLHDLAAPEISEIQIYRGGERLVLPLPAGRAILRSEFDAALLAAALKAGANVLSQTTAEVAEETSPHESFRTVQLQAEAGSAYTVRARVVIVADGLGHPSLQRLPEFFSRIAPQSRIGLGGVLHGAHAFIPDEFSRGTIFMGVDAGGYVGLVRTGETTLNLAAAVDRHRLQQAGGKSSEMVAEILRRAGLPPPEGLTDLRWHGTAGLTRVTSRLAARRLFIVGDAAGYIEPFTGEGMAWAALSARALIPWITPAAGEWRDEYIAGWTRQHRLLIGSQQLTCRMLAEVLRRPLLAAAAMKLASSFPGITRRLARHIARPAATPKGSA